MSAPALEMRKQFPWTSRERPFAIRSSATAGDGLPHRADSQPLERKVASAWTEHSRQHLLYLNWRGDLAQLRLPNGVVAPAGVRTGRAKWQKSDFAPSLTFAGHLSNVENREERWFGWDLIQLLN